MLTNKKQRLLGQILQYLFPSVASMISLSGYILADTFFVAKGVGGIGLAGLNIALPAYALINATGLMLGIGAGVVISMSRGRGETKTPGEAAVTAMASGLVLGLLLSVAGLTQGERMALLLGASEQSLLYAATYIRVLMGFAPIFLLNNILIALVRNDRNPRLAMTAMVISSLSNVALDFLFILVFGWGMFGAALATGIVPMISIAFLSLHWLRGNSTLALRGSRLRLRLLGDIAGGGSSNFFIEMGNGLAILLINLTLMPLAGDLAVAAYGIVANIALVIGNVFIGMGQGIQPLISQYHGQGDSKTCSRILCIALAVAAGAGVVFFAVGRLFPAQLAHVFNSENNAQLAEITIHAIQTYFTAFLLMGFSICCASYFQSVQRPQVAAAISLLRGFGLVAVGVAVLPPLLGLAGVWMIVPAAELLTLPICIVGLATVFRRNRAVRPGQSLSEPQP